MKKVFIKIIIVVLTVSFTGCQTASLDVPRQSISHSVQFKIAYICLTDGYWQVWTMQSDGSGQRQITRTPYDKRRPVWKSENELIYCTNNHRAFVTDLKGNELPILESFGDIKDVIVSPSCDELVFVRIKDHSKNIYHLWTAKLDGSGARMITHAGGRQSDPTWSGISDTIAYIQLDGYRNESLWIMENRDDNTKTKLTGNASFLSEPVFSPDGNKIAYMSDLTNDNEIWVTDVTSGKNLKLTSSKGLDTSPSWTPDGRQICFVSNRAGNPQVFIINTEGDGLVQLTQGSPAIDPVCEKEWPNE